MKIHTHCIRSMSSPFFPVFFGDAVLNNTYDKLSAPLHNGGVACVLLSFLLSSVMAVLACFNVLFFWFPLFSLSSDK